MEGQVGPLYPSADTILTKTIERGPADIRHRQTGVYKPCTSRLMDNKGRHRGTRSKPLVDSKTRADVLLHRPGSETWFRKLSLGQDSRHSLVVKSPLNPLPVLRLWIPSVPRDEYSLIPRKMEVQSPISESSFPPSKTRVRRGPVCPDTGRPRLQLHRHPSHCGAVGA